MEEIESGWTARCKYNNQIKIVWYEDIHSVPKDASKTPFIVAHEFFDALPVHVFQSISPTGETSTITTSSSAPNLSAPPGQRRLPQQNQWRELMVSPVSPYSKPTITSVTDPSTTRSDPKPEFELTLSKTQTPHAAFLPTQSDRYRSLVCQTGSIIEISPDSLAYAADFAIRIGGAPVQSAAASRFGSLSSDAPHQSSKSIPSGAALILDYGPAATIPTNSLRGIKAHKPVSPFIEAGRVDLSADVDFIALAESAIAASPGVEVHGPAEQGAFLQAMGGQARVDALVRQANSKLWKRENEEGGLSKVGVEELRGLEEGKERIEGGWRRLVDRGVQGMGRIYKVLAIVPYLPMAEGQKTKRRPVGFGGDVEV